MTDDNELRRMLGDLADETPEVSTREWLDGTRHKVRVRRRARWAGAGVAAAFVCAAAAVVPQVVDDASTDPAPADPAPKPSSDGEPGWPGVGGAADERVIEARTNDGGSSELQWTTESPGRQTLTSGGRARLYGLSATQFCHMAGEVEVDGSRVQVVSAVDGRIWARSECRGETRYPPVARPVVRRLKDMEIRGEELTVSMWLERDGQRVDVSGAEFGFLLYWECRGEPYPRSAETGGSSAEACGPPLWQAG